MTVVVVCANSYAKAFQSSIPDKKLDIKIIKTISKIKDDFVNTLQSLNPHTLIVMNGVIKENKENSILAELKTIMPSLRIVYIYGEVGNTDNEKQLFTQKQAFLYSIGIYDIISTVGRASIIKEVLVNPMPVPQSVQNKILQMSENNCLPSYHNIDVVYNSINKEISKETNDELDMLPDLSFDEDIATEDVAEPTAELTDAEQGNELDMLPDLSFDDNTATEDVVEPTAEQGNVIDYNAYRPITNNGTVSADNLFKIKNERKFVDNSGESFELFNIKRIVVKEVVREKNTGCIVIGVAGLDKGTGATHTAFEIAAAFAGLNNDVALVLSDTKTYKEIYDYYKVNDKNVDNYYILPFLKKVRIYNEKSLYLAQSRHRFVVIDYGTLNENNKSEYEKNRFKIMCVYADAWNIYKFESFISSVSYSKEIKYFMPLVSKEQFAEVSKNAGKLNLKCFKIAYSPNPFEPCNENIDTFCNAFDGALYKTKKSLFKRK